MDPNAQAMLNQVGQALEQKDYRTATHLLKTLWQEMPENPWVQIYRARLYEAADKRDQAETIYRHLLKDVVTNPKIALQARQGLQRLQDIAKPAVHQSKGRPQKPIGTINEADRDQPGILVLEAIPLDARPRAAKHMAKVMQLDAYTARMQIPNRGWKLYRTGNLGELQEYGEQIRSGDLPAFWVTLGKVNAIPVFQVKSIEKSAPEVVINCENAAGQLEKFTFPWLEIQQKVEGALPILENVVDTDIVRQGTRRLKKTETLDYVRIMDVHLPRRNCILRFCDRTYDFHSGVRFADEHSLDAINIRAQWNALVDLLEEHSPTAPTWKEFNIFASSAMEHQALLGRIDPSIHFYDQGDREEALWASAFQLYSGLAFGR
jgi:tetratricopeptide (TPR) repeat protein